MTTHRLIVGQIGTGKTRLTIDKAEQDSLKYPVLYLTWSRPEGEFPSTAKQFPQPEGEQNTDPKWWHTAVDNTLHEGGFWVINILSEHHHLSLSQPLMGLVLALASSNVTASIFVDEAPAPLINFVLFERLLATHWITIVTQTTHRYQPDRVKLLLGDFNLDNPITLWERYIFRIDVNYPPSLAGTVGL